MILVFSALRGLSRLRRRCHPPARQNALLANERSGRMRPRKLPHDLQVFGQCPIGRRQRARPVADAVEHGLVLADRAHGDAAHGGEALFGLVAVTLMLVTYACERKSPWFILGFAGACVLGSTYGFLQGAWPFGVVPVLESVKVPLPLL